MFDTIVKNRPIWSPCFSEMSMVEIFLEKATHEEKKSLRQLCFPIRQPTSAERDPGLDDGESVKTKLSIG
jgi:hypothetical protein